MSEKVVWQLLQPYATAAGVPGIAPHDLRRYAESRIMPNRQRCDHAGKAWDTARCGIFLAMPVLRVGRDDRRDGELKMDWTKPRPDCLMYGY